MQQKIEAERSRVERFGQVRPLMATEAFGKRLVVVRNVIYEYDKRKYFSNFLWDFVTRTFGSEWCETEAAKTEAERHPVMQWMIEGVRYMSTQPLQADGSRRGIPSGIVAALLNFGYDLYNVADHNELDDLFLHRLKNRDLFQGARHELFAEATCLRAGCSIERENEQDGANRHAEFTAIHNATGQHLSVEAKSKQYAGVLGKRGQSNSKLRLAFGALINSAIRKNPPYPLVIFIDTNLPFHVADKLFPREPGNVPSGKISRALEEVNKQHGGRDPYSMIVFTNHPHHYAARDEKDPHKHVYSVVSTDTTVNEAALRSLHQAALLYGNVPNEFPANN